MELIRQPRFRLSRQIREHWCLSIVRAWQFFEVRPKRPANRNAVGFICFLFDQHNFTFAIVSGLMPARAADR